MSNRVAPERRRFRPFIIVCLPILFVACIIAATGVLVCTQNVWLAVPLFVVSLGPLRMMRWSMVWLSTPGERILFTPGIDQEPMYGILIEIVKKWRGM